jgi:hypothetical protein
MVLPGVALDVSSISVVALPDGYLLDGPTFDEALHLALQPPKLRVCLTELGYRPLLALLCLCSTACPLQISFLL